MVFVCTNNLKNCTLLSLLSFKNIVVVVLNIVVACHNIVVVLNKKNAMKMAPLRFYISSLRDCFYNLFLFVFYAHMVSTV